MLLGSFLFYLYSQVLKLITNTYIVQQCILEYFDRVCQIDKQVSEMTAFCARLHGLYLEVTFVVVCQCWIYSVASFY